MNKSTFDSPARYQISISGALDASWSERLGGMAIVTTKDEGPPITVLTGALADQAALAGVLSGLHELGFSLISVVRINGSSPA